MFDKLTSNLVLLPPIVGAATLHPKFALTPVTRPSMMRDMNRRQTFVILMVGSILIVSSTIVVRIVQRGQEFQKPVDEVDARPQPQRELQNAQQPDLGPEVVLREIENTMRTLNRTTNNLEERYHLRQQANAMNMPFPASLDASLRELQATTLDQLCHIQRIIDRQLRQKNASHLDDKLLAFRKQSDGLRDIIAKMDFGSTPANQ